MIMYRVRFVENFKDGNILNGRAFAANEEEILSEQDYRKIEQSGGILAVMEQMIPNPKKVVEETPVEAQPEKGAKAKKNAK